MRNRKFHKNGSNGIFFLALWQTQYKMRIFFVLLMNCRLKNNAFSAKHFALLTTHYSLLTLGSLH